MPMHDWNKVEAGIFHAFHHEWISEISFELNRTLLPEEYYALPEEVAAGFGPDFLSFQSAGEAEPVESNEERVGGTVATLRTRPETRFQAETEAEFYLRKKSSIVVRHVSGDRFVAKIEIVAPGNKSNRHALRAFVEKAFELLEHRIHLLVLDPFPPGRRDPNWIHAAIWEEVQEVPFLPPSDQPLTFVAYECDFIKTVAIEQTLPEMPIFLEPNGCVMIPLEKTYETAFAAMPRRWQHVLAPSGSN
jgi:Protein of unknown function (DUF4058)